ncbi:unnamed protein product [Rhizophagus irregularis]|nr:unnamed protein product [Rhizophagus irregularis]
MSKYYRKGSSSSKKVKFFKDSSNTNDVFNDPLLKEYENFNIVELKNELQKLEKERDEKKLIFENFKNSQSLRDVIGKENINDSMNMNQNELQDHVRFF